MNATPARSLPVVLVWVGVLGALSCAIQDGQRADTSPPTADGGTTGGALPAGDDGGVDSRAYFWDLEPDTGWMSDYPVFDCPWPQEGDVVREIVSWHAATDFFKSDPDYTWIGHLFDMHGFDFGDGDCSKYDNGEWQDAIQVDLQEGFHLWLRYWGYSFVPGTSEGPYIDTARNPFLGVSVYHSDGDHYSWMVGPGGPTGSTGPYQGVDPYITYCVVRVRPKRIAGAVRIEVPYYRQQDDDGFPADLMDGLYFWWDIKQNEHVHSNATDSNGDPLPCLNDLYEGTTPEEVWPDMPGGVNWLRGAP